MQRVEVSSEEKKAIRRAVWERDSRHCQDCGKLVSWEQMHLHHKKERSLGGTWELDNLATLCLWCHQKYKG